MESSRLLDELPEEREESSRLVDDLAEAFNAREEPDGGWSQVLERITPESAAEVRRPLGATSLHLACGNKAPLDVIVKLIAADPTSILRKDEDGRLPLHYATGSQAEHDVLLALRTTMSLRAEANLVNYLEAAAAQIQDDKGRFALHRALENGAPLKIIKAILAADPLSAAAKDDFERLPLHAACWSEAPLLVVKALLKEWPEGAKEADAEGRLPLHYAAGGQSHPDVILELVRLHPDGITVKDSFGRRPIHRALSNNAPPSIIAALLQPKEKADADEESDEVKKLRYRTLAVISWNKAPLETLQGQLKLVAPPPIVRPRVVHHHQKDKH